MATNYNTSGTSVFKQADPKDILKVELLKGIGTKDHYDFRVGVKGAKFISYIKDVALDISTGIYTGARTGSGQTTVVDVELTNKTFNVFETYSKDVIDDRVIGLGSPGTSNADLPVQDVINELKQDQLFLDVEELIWDADTDASIQSAGTDLAQFDGVKAQVSGIAGNYANAALDFSSASDASIRDHVKSFRNQLVSTLPALVSKQTTLSMSPEQYMLWKAATYGLSDKQDANSIVQDMEAPEQLIVPGTKMLAVAEPGLSGDTYMFLSPPKNVIAVYDLQSESEILDFLWNPFNNEHQFGGQFRVGVKVVDPSLCITTA